jgi:hypothetical protein
MLNILAQAKFLREAQWANEVPLQVQTRTAWFRVGNPGGPDGTIPLLTSLSESPSGGIFPQKNTLSLTI